MFLCFLGYKKWTAKITGLGEIPNGTGYPALQHHWIQEI
jgi:hypothetical protein